MRLVPQSLFGRTLLVLAAGLLVAQLASVALNLFDRGSSVYRLAAFQIASRIAQTARILNRLPPDMREAVSREIDGRHLRVSLASRPIAMEAGLAAHDVYEAAFAAALQRQIGAPWPVNVEISSNPRDRRAPGEGTVATAFEVWVARNFFYLLPSTFSLVAQVELEDGTVAAFYAAIPQEPLSRLESLIPRLFVLLVTCFGIATLLMFMINRPLRRLVAAADSMSDGLDHPPVAETGPSETRRVLAAFNRMQTRLRGHLLDRARMLGALSHDLRTPLTRLRLRAETLQDGEVRDRIHRDLDEMESMVHDTLAFFSDVGREPDRAWIDVDATVGSICEDRRETGQPVSVSGEASAPYFGYLPALRRCIDNLVGNALRYGGVAQVEIRDSPGELRIIVSDQGPGLPPAELERVFEPYYRVEASRNPASGGTGLGLSIARNIARWHGGDVRLANGEDRGLVATLTLPRTGRRAGEAP